MKCKNKGLHDFKIEVILAIFIAACVIGLMYVNETREREVNERYLETLLISTDQITVVDEDLKELITDYRPRPYKMIEIYNEDYELTFRIQFRGESINVKDDITNHPDLIAYFESHSEGHTYYTINDDETDVYFRWCATDGQEGEQLVIIYTSRQQQGNYWMHNMFCYLILIFAFMIVIFSMIKRGHDRVHRYQENQNNIYDTMIR